MTTRRGVDPLAVGLEVRLARLGREDSLTKGMRYLLSGRVMIRYAGPEGVRAWVRGSGQVYRVQFDSGAWSCDCPAKTDQCAHLHAVRSVTIVEDPRGW